MAHEHKLEILRGSIKFKDNVQKIWGVFLLLTIITLVEVYLGIEKPEFLMGSEIFGLDTHMRLLNWIFIILTLVKAYYITWDFMHMRDEKPALRRAVVWTTVFLISYLAFILLQEGGYVHDVYKEGYIKWNF